MHRDLDQETSLKPTEGQYCYFCVYPRPKSAPMPTERLSDIAIQRELGTLPGWSRRGDVITKTFQFREFLTGIDFVNAVAKAAEAADHHPDIDIRYTKVTFALSTHSAGGITQKDLDLAKKIEAAGQG